MNRANTMIRLCRSLSGLTQSQFEEATGIPNIGCYETGLYEPTTAQLVRCARAASRTLGEMERVLREYEQSAVAWPWEPAGLVLRTQERETERGRLDLAVRQFTGWAAQAGHLLHEDRLRQRQAERARALELRKTLEPLLDGERRDVVRLERTYQSWALAESSADYSEWLTSKDIEEAKSWAELASFIAARVEPAPLRLRVEGYCSGHVANARRVMGTLPASEREFVTAYELWESGEDLDGILDPGRLLELEASLRKDQRKPAVALKLLKQAEGVSRRPAHVMLKKGLTLAVLGEHEAAIEALLKADPLIEQRGEARLRNVQKFSLASNYCHLNRHEEAAALAGEVRQLASQLGDELDLTKVVWLEGRIAAGLGRRTTALRALRTAAEQAAERGMLNIVALAHLEEAVLLLEMGRSEEVQEIASKLAPIFAGNGVHPEALAALTLFQNAVERRVVTERLTRGVLKFLFRASGDDDVKWSEDAWI